MGNRAIITTSNHPSAPAIYLHWNGGPESVLAFLSAAKQLGVRSPVHDSDYFMGRLGQIIGNFFGGTTSFGFGQADYMDDGDNGKYVIGGDFEIIERSRVSGIKSIDQLSDEGKEEVKKMTDELIRINAPIFKK